MVEHIMRDAEPVGNRACIANILAGAARAGALHRRAMIVELQRHADRFGARLRGQSGHDRAVDAARHGDDDALGPEVVPKLEIGEFGHNVPHNRGGGRFASCVHGSPWRNEPGVNEA